jgi:hypothetical protein
MTDQTVADMKEMRKQGTSFSPTFEAYNDDAIALVSTLIKNLGLSEAGPKTIAKHRIILASVLAQSTKATEQPTLAVSMETASWTNYDVGKTAIKQVFTALETHGFINFVEGSGKFLIYEGDDGKKHRIGVKSQYLVKPSLLDLQGLEAATWIDTGRPTVLVSVKETYARTHWRKSQGISREKMTTSKVKAKFGRGYGKAVVDVNRVNSMWRNHPLYLTAEDNRQSIYAASATRIYHNGKLTSGGRYYGAWSNIGSMQRLKCTIDGEPVVSVDLNASQPTLFSSLMGKRMNVSNWSDLYEEALLELTLLGASQSDTTELRRAKIKQATVEMIGLGNAYKQHPAKDAKVKFRNQGEYFQYQYAMKTCVPALELLNDKLLNGPNFISYHEAEIMQQTLEVLIAAGVPAYPVHDCVIVQKRYQELAVTTYRQILRDYVLEHNRKTKADPVDITIPVSIEESGKVKKRLEGYYQS